jgi:hypothetical protein
LKEIFLKFKKKMPKIEGKINKNLFLKKIPKIEGKIQNFKF